MSSRYTDYRTYTKTICLHRTSFPCPLCDQSLLPKAFEKHCTQQHALNARLCCVWCQGQRTWPAGHKHHHVDHLLPCFRHFMKLQQLSSNAPDDFPLPPDPLPFDLTPMAAKHSLFHHSFHPPARAYDLIWPLPLDPHRLTFEDDSLNKAVACVRKYVSLGNAVEWFHIMVRTLAFPHFLRAMDADAGRSRTLPFSCWCDGGQPTAPHLRQHRHLIVVSSPPGHFTQHVWQHLDVAERPGKYFRCVHKERIVSPLHLVNTLGYVCQRESRCQFSSDPGPEKQNHFYLFECLPKDYRLPLVLQWEGGLLQLLDQQFKNLPRGELVQAALTFFEGKWRFQIQHIPGIPLGLVLPVSRECHPCPEPTDAFLHLTRHRKLFFKRDSAFRSLSRDAWLENQADMGNLFYSVVGQDYWTPRPDHQKLIYEFKPLVDRNRELASDLAQLRETCRTQHEPLQADVVQWKRKYEASERDVVHWKRQHEASERDVVHWKRQHEASERDKKTLSLQVHALNDKIHQLNDKIHQLNEGEIVRLKRGLDALGQELAQVTQENKALKKENEALKKENEALKRDLDRLRRPNISVHFTKPPL